MNQVRSIHALNARELEAGIAPEASWHRDFADTAYVYIGGLPFELSEGDIITIFSQYGEPTHVHLVRDRETGKSKGFAFLKYEDQRSTDLAVDNLGGAQIMGRALRVDHTRYKKKEGQDEDESKIEKFVVTRSDDEANKESEDERPMLKEEIELAKLINNHEDDEDPIKAYRVEQKREEVETARKKLKRKSDVENGHRHRNRHRSRQDRKEDFNSDSKRLGHRPKPGKGRISKDDGGRWHHRRSKSDEDAQEGEDRHRPDLHHSRHERSDSSSNGRDRHRRKGRARYDSSEDERGAQPRRDRSREKR